MSNNLSKEASYISMISIINCFVFLYFFLIKPSNAKFVQYFVVLCQSCHANQSVRALLKLFLHASEHQFATFSIFPEHAKQVQAVLSDISSDLSTVSIKMLIFDHFAFKKTVPTDLKLSLATFKPVIKATNSKRNGVFLKLTQESVFVVVDLNLNLLDSQGRRFIVIFYRFLLIRYHVICMIDSCGVGGSFIFLFLLPNEFFRSVLAFAPSNYQQD